MACRVVNLNPFSFARAAATDRPVSGNAWMLLLCSALLGYAVLGRGWAYVGVAPLFVGEITLFFGGLWLVTRGQWRHIDTFPHCVLFAMAAWGVVRTLPYLSEYGIDALRDAVIWGYAAFAVIVSAYLQTCPTRLATLLSFYRRFARFFLVAIPVVWATRFLLGGAMPRWPWADVPVLEAKAGDIMVHLAGITAFWVAGFDGKIGWIRVLLLTVVATVIGAYERAGLVSFALSCGLCLCLRPDSRLLHRMLALGLAGVAALALSGIRFEVPSPETTKVREVSFQYVMANVVSVVSDTGVGDLDDTKEWRLDWWNDILDYTLRGQYFWEGKGFGINLADDDGYQVNADGSLRSPHNAHLTMLARAGVPGFSLWALAHLAWLLCVTRAYCRSRRLAEPRWSALFLFLLAYWLAFMTNATFDVFIEGPMGGIWFWTLYGTGLAAVALSRHCPDVLDASEPTAFPWTSTAVATGSTSLALRGWT